MMDKRLQSGGLRVTTLVYVLAVALVLFSLAGWYVLRRGLSTSLEQPIIAGILLLAAAVGLLAAILSRRVAKSLHELNRAARAFAQGNYGERISVQGHDEVSELARSFNEMGQALATLHESAQHRLHNLSLLYQTSVAISTILNEQTIYDMVVQAFAKIFNVAQCGLVVFDEDRLWGRLVAQYQERPDTATGDIQIPLRGNASMEWIEAHKRPLAVADAQHDPLLASVHEVMVARNVKSILIVPLIEKGTVIGTIGLDATDQPRTFSAEEISLAQTVANQIAGVAQNARLYRQMAEEKRKFELVATNMGEGLIILDRADKLLFVNPQARAMLGLGNSSLLGRPLREVCPRLELAELLARRPEAGAEIVKGEISVSDKTVRDLTISLAPVRDEMDELQWWVMVIHDITHLKEVDRLKSEFVSTVSHELRTPLASILGFSEMLLTRQPGPLNEVQAEFLHIVYESSQQLLRLVNDLLDVSRMEAGKLELHRRSVDMRELLSRLVTAVQPLARRKNLNLHLSILSDLPTIIADPYRIEQVLNNLLSNAMKFTPDGGEIALLARLEDSSRLHIAVSDTGIGIPPQDVEKLFTKFYRSEEAIKKAIAGTGLGLYIAKNLIEAHGGQIGAESRPGAGTTIWFTLPIGTLPD